MHHGAIGVELGGGVARVVGELFDQVFIRFAQVVLGHRLDAQRDLAEVLNQVGQQVVG
ncbi:hypothetical protein D3C80_1878890 [compost metagenome]